MWVGLKSLHFLPAIIVIVQSLLRKMTMHLMCRSLKWNFFPTRKRIFSKMNANRLTDDPDAWMLLNTLGTRIFFRRCALTCVLPRRWNCWRLCHTRGTTLPWRPRGHRSWPGAPSLWVYLHWGPIHWALAYSLNPMKTIVLVVPKVVAEHCVHYLLKLYKMLEYYYYFSMWLTHVSNTCCWFFSSNYTTSDTFLDANQRCILRLQNIFFNI